MEGGGRTGSEQGSALRPGWTTTPIKLQALRLAVCQVKPFFSCGWGEGGGGGGEGAGDGGDSVHVKQQDDIPPLLSVQNRA